MALLFPPFQLSDPEATARAARALGDRLSIGDVVLLEGDVGAGKTHFARALLQSQLSTTEDVPSPTFTLVQTYDTPKSEIWHADLYRIGSVQEIEELCLSEAFETAICLIEWPDRLGELKPFSALTVTLTTGEQEDTRLIYSNP